MRRSHRRRLLELKAASFMLTTPHKVAFIPVLLLASCATATSKPANTLLAEELPAEVTSSRTGDFNVDSATELAWSTRVSVPLTYPETRPYCESLGKGWRLPTVGELQTIMSPGGDAMRLKPEWRKGLPAAGLLFSGEEVPRVDDIKQPFVVRIENGESFAGDGLEGYVRCVHGSISREQRPMPMPPEALMADRWWEQSDACPANSVARGTAGRLVACKNPEGQTMGRSSSWTRTQRVDASYRNDALHGPTVKWRAEGLKISEENYQDGELHGLSSFWFANGEKARESNYASGKLEGKDLKWRPDGLMEAELTYRNGELHGRAAQWYENGEPASDATYADGMLHGKAQKWRANGLEESMVSYRKGKLHGPSTVWYENGEKYSESIYANGKLNGKVLIWRADGLKESEKNYRNGELHGSSTTWFANGETATESVFANGKLHGKSVTWRADGLKESEKNYRNGELHGTSTFYFANGETSSESNYSSGVMSGVHQRWTEEGHLLERTVYTQARVVERMHYDKGEPRDGAVETQYPNGIVSYVGVFKNGLAVGKHYGFYPNGEPKFERNYNAKGIPSGRSVDWNSTGQAHEVSNYVRGALHGERTFFTKEGKLKERFHYNQGVLIER